ncbi:MAG: hypothetical protein V1798_07620 [Pseudomonadota bacterium]
MRGAAKFSKRGFTVLELVAVLVVIIILSAVGSPLLSRYFKRMKTAEALTNLRKIYDGEVAYYQQAVLSQGGAVPAKRFVACPPTPANIPGAIKQYAIWDDPAWQAIRFAPDAPVLYRYSVAAGGVEKDAAFTARAEGDIDGNKITSNFERVGSVDPVTGAVVGGAVFALNPLE